MSVVTVLLIVLIVLAFGCGSYGYHTRGYNSLGGFGPGEMLLIVLIVLGVPGHL